ncbi:MAG TPA: efflux RND transporter permease subunit [Nitrospiraceae bacterium]
MLTRAALKNPFAVFAICMIVLILGWVSYQKMKIDIFPDINIPVILVSTFYRGLSPGEMEGAITLRFEQQFLQASYIEHIESQSLAGMSYIKVFFQPEYSIDAAQSELTSLAYSIIRLLPPGVFPPSVYKFGVASLPIGLLTVSSDTMSEKEMRDLAYFTVRPQMASIPGISTPPVLGGKLRQITVFMDQSKMQGLGISPSEVVKSINAQNAILPAGDVKIGDLDYNLYSNSLIDVVSQINSVPIKVVNGTPVFIRDIGTAADSSAIQTSIVRVNGRESVYIPVTKQEGANTLAVADAVHERIPKLTEIPAGATVKFLYDQSLYIRQAISNLQKEGLMGAGLAGLMIYLFLRSIKAALVVGLAIPLSLTSALVLLFLSDQSVNIMTLGGLALVIGTLLDNNIVVQENLHRHLEMGKDGRSAAEDSATELTLPILVATICILIVYLPIMFFSGIVKYLFVPLAMTVAFAMSADYLISMSVTPVILAKLYAREQQTGHGQHNEEESGWFGTLVGWYTFLLRLGLRLKPLVVIVVLTALVATFALVAPTLHTEFFPKVDAGNFTMLVTAPEGTRIEKTTAIIGRIESLVKDLIPKEDLDEVISNTGLYYGDAARFAPNTGPHTAFVLVNLVTGHKGETDHYIADLRERLRKDLPGVEVAFQTGGIVSDVLNFGLRAPVDIQVKGPRLDLIRPVAEEIQQRVAQITNTVDVRIKQGKSYPELHLNVDRTKAAYFGLDQQKVVVDVITGISSNIALSPNYWLDPKTANGYFLLAQYPEQDLTKVEDLLNTPLIGTMVAMGPASAASRGMTGSTLGLSNTPFANQALALSGGYYNQGTDRQGPSVRLRDVAELIHKTGPDSVDHYDLSRLIDVLVTITGNDLGRVAAKIEDVIKEVRLPKDVVISIKGEVANMRAAFENFALALPLAVVLIYLVMVGLFRSFIDPLIILLAVPLGWIGTVLMLALTNTSVNVESMIGTLMMMGIVVSNSILLVDFANRMSRSGLPADQAVVEAGRRRIRPIVMTALATILGLLPLALGFGEGNETMVPLARAVVGGLLVSTVMTLLVVPILHSLVLAREQRTHHRSATPTATSEEI